VVSGRSNAYHAAAVADALDARLTACGSAGVKAMLVVTGEVDIYVHASGLYEWDVCAPAAVAAAAGLVVTDLAGRSILYNKPQPVVRGLVISRPEYADTVRTVLAS
jgi:3'(2'), 5'-bisphosphate nucleotidase